MGLACLRENGRRQNTNKERKKQHGIPNHLSRARIKLTPIFEALKKS